MSEFGSGSYPGGMMPSKQIIAPEYGPYTGEAYDGDYVRTYSSAVEAKELDAQIEAEQAEKEALFNAVVRAQTELQSAASFLITEAIGEGEPSRDITSHPDYIEANEALIRAQSALEAYTKGVSPEI